MTRIRTARASLLAALLLPGLATAAGLNDTGITGCANGTQSNLTCPQEPNFPRQDADIGRDAQATARKPTLSKAGGGSAGFDFTKLGADGNVLAIQNGTWRDEGGSEEDGTKWSCVRDNVTGLIWEIKTADGGLRDKNWTYTWYNPDPDTNGSTDPDTNDGAGSEGDSGSCEQTLDLCNTQAYVAAVNGLTTPLCGYSDDDWRMPTIEELRSIMDSSITGPAIDADYFPDIIKDFSSASPYVLDAYSAWGVASHYGNVGVGSKGDRNGVRLVRGGQSPNSLETTPTTDFVLDNINGTTYHKKTGLTWMRCVLGQSWDSTNETCTGGPVGYTWDAALGAAQDYSFAGFSDWRLPNQKELASIVERRNFYPAINLTVFPNTPFSYFWSASPVVVFPDYAASVLFDNGGEIGYAKLFYDLAVRLVRGGQYSLLSVTKAGDGGGTVTSNLPGIDCGKYCKGSFANEMFATAGEIILTANPDTNSVFESWEGCTPLTEGNKCTFALRKVADTSVTANFSPKPTSTLSITDVSQNEGNKGKNFTFTITLSPASTGTVTVNYATADGTATAGSDYTAASGTLTFEAGQKSKTVTVQVTGDKLLEGDEIFSVNLSNPSGATILDGQGLGTIRNDD